MAEAFGSSVAILDDLAVVGDPLSGEPSIGSVYVFRHAGDSWAQVGSVFGSQAESGFGCAFAILEDYILVGANQFDIESSDEGAVFAYRFNGTDWILEQQIVALDHVPNARFGSSIVVDGDFLFVGAPDDFGEGLTSGAVYLFTFDGMSWNQVQKLFPEAGIFRHDFGHSLAADGDRLIVGAPGSGQDFDRAGSAYIFRYDGTEWAFEQKLDPDDGVPHDRFGSSVSIQQGTAIAGAPFNDGGAYVFLRSGLNWVQHQKIISYHSIVGERYFGQSVALVEEGALVASTHHDHGGGQVGAIYLFTLAGDLYEPAQEFLAFDARHNDRLGAGLAVDMNTVLAGAPGDTYLGDDGGSAYMFCTNPGSCCNAADGSCLQGRRLTECGSDNETWWDTPDCTEVECAGIVGACCRALPELGSDCVQSLLAECPIGPSTFFSPNAECSKISCFQSCPADILNAMDPTPTESFGTSVSMSDNRILVGARNDDDSMGQSGSATIFRLDDSSWVIEQELFSDTTNPNDLFGSKTFLMSNTAFVSTLGDNPEHVDVFQFSNEWTKVEELYASGSSETDFGIDIAGFGTRLVVAANRAAYVFIHNGVHWVEERKIEPTLSGIPVLVRSVAIDQDFIMIGTPASHGGAGSVFVYYFDGASWSLHQFLQASNLDEGDYFGGSMALSGGVAIIGAPKPFVGHSLGAGSAYIFRLVGNQWIEEQELLDETTSSYDKFGFAVAITNDIAVVGAYYDNDLGPIAGAAYLYQYNGESWYQTSKLFAPNHEPGDQFGWSVDVSGQRAIIGAPGYRDGFAIGQAYVYQLQGLGACCNRQYGSCLSCVQESLCQEPALQWTEDSECADAGCTIGLGACCNRAADGNPTLAECTQTVFADCVCPTCEWTIDADCEDIACDPTYGPIPTVSQWGLVILTLTILITAKAAFATRAKGA